MPDTFEVGFRFPSAGADVDAQIRMATEAEAAGFDAVYSAETWGLEAFTRLGYLANSTEDLRLGTAIVPVHARSPALLAQSVVTLAELADRPVVLGLGLSSAQVVEHWHGVAFEPALRRQREAIEIVRTIVAGDRLSYEGRVFSLDFENERLPNTDHDVEIRVGAQGDRNVELVGGFADGWLPLYIPIERISAAREILARGAERRDRSVEEVDVVPSVFGCVGEDGESARDRCRESIAFYVGAMGRYHANVLSRYGFKDVVKSIETYWSDGEYEAARGAVTDELLDQVTISGTPESVGPILTEYRKAFDGLTIVPPSRATYNEVASTIRAVGQHFA